MSKTVAEPSSIPSDVASELEASQAEAAQSASADTERKSKVDNLAKARAAKAAKAAAATKKVTVEEPKFSIADRLELDRRTDADSFGSIQEVPRLEPRKEEYVRVNMPLTDIFDHSHPGVQLNRHKFEPGKTYLLRADVALEVNKRLAMFHDEQVRLLRPNADRKALSDVNRGSQWTSRGGTVTPLRSLSDVSTDSPGDKVFTVDF